MRFALLSLVALTLICGVASADGPRVSTGPAGNSGVMPTREDVCQYGFTDTSLGTGWTLDLSQQLGILCTGPMTVLRVGFYCEFIAQPGTCDIVVRDNGVEVSRTPVQPAAGNNEFDIPDTPVSGNACVMLCPVGGFWAVTGEDYNAPIEGMTYWSNSCECTNAFTDNDLMIWVVSEGNTPVESTTWGAIRHLFFK
jgi:hypothetical protein